MKLGIILLGGAALLYAAFRGLLAGREVKDGQYGWAMSYSVDVIGMAILGILALLVGLAV